MPDLLLETLGTHTSSPAPISTTVKKTLADFKKSHQDVGPRAALRKSPGR